MDLWSEYVEDPVSDVVEDVVGEDAYEIIKDVTTVAGAAALAPIIGATALVAAPVAIPAYLAYMSYQAGESAEETAARAALMEQEMTAEQVRILEEENLRTVATARARAGASGLSGASSELYISALEETGRQDVDWLKRVGISAYQSRVDEGRAASQQAQMQMWGYAGQAISGFTDTAKMFASFG